MSAISFRRHKMGKQKTGFWKAHPLLKAIMVLIGFILLLSLSFYCPTEVPIFGAIFYVFTFFYLTMGIYFFGCLYGIWLDRSCHLRILSFCFLLLLLVVIVLIGYFFLYVYPDWMRNGYIIWKNVHSSIYLVYAQILSVVGGYILSKVISYFARKDCKKEETSI